MGHNGPGVQGFSVFRVQGLGFLGLGFQDFRLSFRVWFRRVYVLGLAAEMQHGVRFSDNRFSKK